MALEDEKCVDVTYEDPAEALQALRERMDCERAVAHGSGELLEAAQACVRAALAAGSDAAAAGASGAGSSHGARADDEDSMQPCLPGCMSRYHTSAHQILFVDFRDFNAYLPWLECLTVMLQCTLACV